MTTTKLVYDFNWWWKWFYVSEDADAEIAKIHLGYFDERIGVIGCYPWWRIGTIWSENVDRLKCVLLVVYSSSWTLWAMPLPGVLMKLWSTETWLVSESEFWSPSSPCWQSWFFGSGECLLHEELSSSVSSILMTSGILPARIIF